MHPSEHYGEDCVFQTLAPKLWNNLPLSLCTLDSVASLKNSLKLIYSDSLCTEIFRKRNLAQVK